MSGYVVRGKGNKFKSVWLTKFLESVGPLLMLELPQGLGLVSLSGEQEGSLVAELVPHVLHQTGQQSLIHSISLVTDVGGRNTDLASNTL